ncbi:MAG TPA: HlyD family type I secretion periplasmic adaptor subunit [Geobacterales bacterium]|nr:HlyD family type I secretion periplasmic adaptor subunit [Geobacterales bacterium]
MSTVKTIAKAPPSNAVQKSKLHPEDFEFLPADLEILETPPSPVRMALILIICAFVATALIWSWIGHIDIVAVAQGKIQPTGRVKVIQPLETGKVAAIMVENGRRVKAGDLMIEMDIGDARAEEDATKSAYEALRAEARRRRTAIDAAQTHLLPQARHQSWNAETMESATQRRLMSIPKIDWDAGTPEQIRQRENQVLAGDLEQLKATISDFEAQIRQKEIEHDRLDEAIAMQDRLIATLKERVDMRAVLAKSGSGSNANLIDAKETMLYHLSQQANQKVQRDATIANLDVLAGGRDKAFSNFIAENAQKLAEAQKQADDWREKLAKAKFKSERMSLKSPIDGVVYGLSVTTIGQVVGGGEELMRIVPEDAMLEIECYLANKDIGFVKPGQNAVVKIESFPFTRYGTLSATVTRVASDAIPEPDASQMEGNSARQPKDKGFAGAQRTQNLVFPVTLTPARKAMIVDGLTVPLTPGMAVNVEIATGNRRILEYIFSPLVETASQAGKER